MNFRHRKCGGKGISSALSVPLLKMQHYLNFWFWKKVGAAKIFFAITFFTLNFGLCGYDRQDICINNLCVFGKKKFISLCGERKFLFMTVEICRFFG